MTLTALVIAILRKPKPICETLHKTSSLNRLTEEVLGVEVQNVGPSLLPSIIALANGVKVEAVGSIVGPTLPHRLETPRAPRAGTSRRFRCGHVAVPPLELPA